VVFDPLPVDRDVALEKAEALFGEELSDPVASTSRPKTSQSVVVRMRRVRAFR